MLKKELQVTTFSEEETFQIGTEFGKTLKINSIVALFGDLGAGKTTFIRGIVSSLGMDGREVCSPTFNYLNIYEGPLSVYHFDLYRLTCEEEFLAAGFEDFFH